MAENECPVLTVDDLGALYEASYGQMVRVATLLLGDVGMAEEVVQEAFMRVFAKLSSLRQPERAEGYVYRTVVNLARSRLRRRVLAARLVAGPASPSQVDDDVVELVRRAAVVVGLRKLPTRQREAVVLRYYAQFSESEAATVMGVSVGAVRAYTARGAARLREELKELR